MKDLITSVPPSVLFLVAFASTVALGAVKLAAMLQAVAG